MIKKIIACLTICFIITGIISPVFSDASALPQPNWSDPGISEIINISDLTGWMLNGGTYDVSTYTDAESFMNDYYTARTKTRLEGSDYVVKHYYGIEEQYYDIGDSAYVHPLDFNRAISTSYRDHVGYGRRLSNEVNEALLSSGSLYDTKIPLLNEIEFANFVNYNHDALRLYSEFFDIEHSGPNIPSDIQTLIDVINKRENLPNRMWLGFAINPNGTLASYFNSNNVTWFNPNNFSLTTKNSTLLCWKNTIQNIYINSTGNDTYNCQFSWGNDTITINYQGTVFNYNNAYYPNPSGWLQMYDYTNYYPINFNSSGSLNQIFNALKDKVKNVNIYVDNILWSAAGDSAPIQPDPLTPEFPDAVGGEDLPSTTWPISRPRAPYYTSVPGVLQAIEDAIADDGKLDIDDLKPYLTDENGDPVPDPIFDPEPIPLPVPDPVNPDVIPGLPEIPVIPLDMPGYNGVSVLAEIINFTNQSLPNYLIVTFWGIVFGIVILGLIKILHK